MWQLRRLPCRLEQDSVGSGTGDLGTVNSNHMKLIEWLGLENTRDRSKQHPEKRVSPPCTQKFKYMKTDYKKMRKYLVFHGKFLAQEVKAQSMVWPVVNVWSWEIKFQFTFCLTHNTAVEQSLSILQGRSEEGEWPWGSKTEFLTNCLVNIDGQVHVKNIGALQSGHHLSSKSRSFPTALVQLGIQLPVKAWGPLRRHTFKLSFQLVWFYFICLFLNRSST